ncbi:MAG: ATP synthase subunit B family protein [Planctomycetota bacterium]|jgi:vacuolar-type H+-ATPase subunit H
MKRIIEDVLATEEKVSAILKDAREKASEISRSAEKEVSEKISDAKEQARELIKTAVEDAKEEGRRIGEDKLKAADSEKDALLKDNENTTNRLVDNICKIVLTTACEGKKE